MRSQLFRLLVPVLCAAAAMLSGCLTRIETESYTITHRDTTIIDAVRNAPGERDNGAVFPRSREVDIHRDIVTNDSSHDRRYPDFLRMGGLELAGFIGTGAAANSYSGGLFGAYGQLDHDAGAANESHTIKGGLVRLLPYESRLRWFHDSPNWAFGTSAAEFWIPEMDINKMVWSVLPFYFKKRFYLRDQAPYIIVQPQVGIGWMPWQYANIGGTVDVGSWGGLNFRAYFGYIAGERPKFLALGGDSISRTNGFPYVGLGISVLDFVNNVEETRHEWKEYKNHAIEISGLSIDVVHSFVGTQSEFDSAKTFPTGMAIRVATMAYPLWPIDKHLFVGTTLFTLEALGKDVGGMSVLPIRVGYHLPVLPDELTDEAYVEYNYYPSAYFHIADKFTLDLSNIFGVSLNATIGYMSGNAGNASANSFITPNTGFSGSYIAFGVGIADNIFAFDKIASW